MQCETIWILFSIIYPNTNCFQHKLQISAQEIFATDELFIDKQRKRYTWMYETGNSPQRENTYLTENNTS